MPQMTELDPQRFVMPVSAREADEVRIRDQDSGAFIPAPWEQGTVLREAESGPLLSIGIRTGWMARGASGHWLHFILPCSPQREMFQFQLFLLVLIGPNVRIRSCLHLWHFPSE